MRGHAVAGRGMRVVLVAGMLALVFVCLSAAVVSASAPGWSKPVNVTDTTGESSVNAIHALSCVSRSFCVAVTTSGEAVRWSGSTWSAPTEIASGGVDELSCASVSFCIAIGSGETSTTLANGETSTSGYALTLTWNGSVWGTTTTNLGDSQPITDVSCASVSFCLAVDSQGDTLTWNGSTWSAPSDEGGGGPDSVSCVSATFCASASDADDGDALTTWNGSAWSAPTTLDNLDNALGFQVSCASASLCFAFNAREQGGGYVATWNGSTWGAPVLIDRTKLGGLPNSIDGVSCVSASFCVAVDFGGNALTWNGSAWSVPAKADKSGFDTLNAVSCVSASFCVAGDDGGRVLTYGGAGGPTGVTSTGQPTAGQLKASVLAQLMPKGKAAKLAALIKATGYSTSFAALGAGTLVIDWYYLPKGAHLASSKPKPVLVAAGKRTFAEAGIQSITLKLTTAGKKLLKHAKRITLTANGTFTAPGTPTVTATKRFTLTR